MEHQIDIMVFHLYNLSGVYPDVYRERSKNYIIKPDGFTIPSGVSKIHGITTERAIREGVELSSVLSNFQTITTKATFLVAHNMEFDEKIVGCEFYRITGRDPLTAKQKFCTMPALTFKRLHDASLS